MFQTTVTYRQTAHHNWISTMLNHADFQYVINRDEKLRQPGTLAASLLETAADLLDGQTGAARAEKTLCEEFRERLERQRRAL